MEILRVENLVKTYGKGENQVQALAGVSFSVEKGNSWRLLDPPVLESPHCCIFWEEWTARPPARCI